MAEEYENGRLLRYRVDELEKDVRDLEERLNKKLDRVQSTLNRLLFTIASGSIGCVLAILVGSGRL